MEIKFQQQLDKYKYLIMFDLASKNTGVCIWDLKQNHPLATTALKVTGQLELPAAELLKLLVNFFHDLVIKYGISGKEVLVAKEAMPSQLRGGSSTVQTFVALARSHCTLDTLLYQNAIATYDYIGIYPITWHNYFKKLTNLKKEDKVTKELVHDYVVNKYNLDSKLSLDESDAVFMCEAFLAVKWNNDLKERMLEVKRHRKTLKAPHAIKACDAELERLAALKILDN